MSPTTLTKASSLEDALFLLKAGDCVGLPTETVYGLAADALNPKACEKIFKLKGRPANDPLIVHVLNLAQAEKLAEWNDPARKLVRMFWPGPLTVVLKKTKIIPDGVTAGQDSVALRSPAHPVFREVLKKYNKPLAAPSANRFGKVSPTTADAVREELGNTLCVLEGGACAVGVESTILDMRDPANPKLLRAGGISTEILAKALATKIISPQSAANTPMAITPGSLKKHYQPATKVMLWRDASAHPPANGENAVVFFYKRTPTEHEYALSTDGTAESAAQRLYGMLRALDAQGYKKLWMQTPPTDGLGAAIHDRLTRAAAE